VGRRALDPRPPIEVVGADDELMSVQRVSTGPRRPSGGRGRALALAAGVVGLLLGGLALGGDDDESASPSEREERDNRERAEIKPSTTATTRPRTTTTRPATTTTTIPVGPVFGQPVGASLLTFGSSDWVLVDLDTGARRDVTLPTAVDWYSVRPVTGGVVVGGQGQRTAVYYDVLGSGDDPRSVELGEADQVLWAGRPDQVWLVDSGGLFEGEPASDTTHASLVDLSGRVLRSFDLPGTYVSAGVAQGIVLSRGGRAYLADEAGVHVIATGYVMGATADALLLLACDDHAACALELAPIGGGRSTELLRFPGIEDSGFELSTSPDGDFAVLGYSSQAGGGPSLWLFTADGRSQGSYDISAEGWSSPPSWLPSGVGVLVPRGGQVEWIQRREGSWISVPAPALDGLAGELSLVIRP
jgi:hypothetical protein